MALTSKVLRPLRKGVKAYHIAKGARKINRSYESVSRPLWLFEITKEHFGGNVSVYLPLPVDVKTVSSLFGVYSTVSSTKDVSESIVELIRKGKRFSSSPLNVQVVSILKLYVTLYKILWFLLENQGVTKASVCAGLPLLMALIDYMNFIISYM